MVLRGTGAQPLCIVRPRGYARLWKNEWGRFVENYNGECSVPTPCSVSRGVEHCGVARCRGANIATADRAAAGHHRCAAAAGHAGQACTARGTVVAGNATSPCRASRSRAARPTGGDAASPRAHRRPRRWLRRDPHRIRQQDQHAAPRASANGQRHHRRSDQRAESVSQALRYTPGVLAETYGGASQFNSYTQIRGFQYGDRPLWPGAHRSAEGAVVRSVRPDLARRHRQHDDEAPDRYAVR